MKNWNTTDDPPDVLGAVLYAGAGIAACFWMLYVVVRFVKLAWTSP